MEEEPSSCMINQAKKRKEVKGYDTKHQAKNHPIFVVRQ
jgi:hypothetical protein